MSIIIIDDEISINPDNILYIEFFRDARGVYNQPTDTRTSDKELIDNFAYNSSIYFFMRDNRSLALYFSSREKAELKLIEINNMINRQG